MKKYYYIFVFCLFASINLYCDCDFADSRLRDDYYFSRGVEGSFTIEGGVDTLEVDVNPMYVISREECDLNWTLEEGSAYDWHAAQIKETHLSPATEAHDSIDGGWFQIKKLRDLCWSGVEIKVQPNTTGKNRYAEIKLYHEKTGAAAQVSIYQDSK